MAMVRAGMALGERVGDKQEMRFRRTAADTGGELLEIDAAYAPHGDFPPPHVHPEQDEMFLVLEGTLTVRIDGREARYGRGQTFAVPRGAVHTMANRDAAPVCVRWEVRPALETAEFYADYFRLEGPDAPRGLARLARFLLLARRYRREIALVKPAPAIQRLIFALLAPVAWLAEGRTVRTIDERIAIGRSPAEVFAIFADYDHDPAWRAGVSEMLHEPAGPIRAGTTTRETMRLVGLRLVTDARVTAHDPGQLLAFETTSGPIRARGTRTVAPLAAGAEARYVVTAELRGALRLLSPILTASFRRETRGNLARLKEIVEGTAR